MGTLAAVPVMAIALRAWVGVLFLIRRTAAAHGTWWQIIAALPAVIIAGFAFRLSEAENWPMHARVLFVAATTMTIVTFAFLGRSFAILPAVRKVVTRGPYRWIRHPAYAFEWLMILACALARPSVAVTIVATVAVPLIVIRIMSEERLLMRNEDYRAYARRVRWRIIPHVW
jgi:protein-S-isoprenylcysteine O-methyltransferase Ste14